MKKTLIALAALSAAASFAQSSVQIVGTFDPSIANSKTSYVNGSSLSNTFVRNNSQGTSQITFKGTEDLGGGLKASFLFENDFDTRFDAQGPAGTSPTVRGVNFGSGGGEQFLGLEGGFGSVKIGAANTPTLTAQASRQPFGTKIGSGFKGDGVGVLGQGHVRSNNSIVYATPVFNGLSAAVAYGFKYNAAPTGSTEAVQATTVATAASTVSNNLTNQAAITDIGVNYANGPLSAGLSAWKTDAVPVGGLVTTATPAVNQTNLYAAYDFGVAKLMGGYHTEKQDAYTSSGRPAGANYDGWNLAAAVPLNANLSLLANYGKLNDKLAARAAAPLDKTIAAVGLRYNLSKNTSLYARYIEEKNDNVAAAVTNNWVSTNGTNTAAKVQTTLVGMQTNF